MNNFGQYIRQLRKEKEWTQAKLAGKLIIDTGNLSKIETGKKKFNEKQLEELAKIFEIDFNEIKIQYYSDKLADIIYDNKLPAEVQIVTEQKVEYKKSKNTKQGSLNL